MKKIIIRVAAVLAVLAAGWGAYSFVKKLDQGEQVVPTALVRKGDVVIRTYTRGELRAVRSGSLIAPNLFGTVQITRLAPLGAFAREKDLIVEFDDSEVRSRLEEEELEMEQLDEQIKKSQAELDIRNNQDQVELLQARYSLRRAELEVKRNELLSSIDQKKNLLSLDEATRRLKQLESDIKSRLQQAEAELAVLREKKSKALLELQREKQRLSQVKLLAPMSGLVAVRQQRPMGFFFRGMQLPDLREGDQVFPGTPVADLMDLSELEVSAKVGELDRANLREGQEVMIRLDAVPEKTFHGKIKNLSGTASANIWSGDPAKKFDVVFSVDMKELLSGLGAPPDQIRRVLETAERNRKKSHGQMARLGPPPGMFEGGGPGGGNGQMVMAQAGGAGPGAGAQAGAGEPAAGEQRVRRFGGEGAGEGRRGGRFAGLSEEDQQKVRAEMQKITGGKSFQDMTPEEQQKARDQMRALFQKFQQSSGDQGQPGAGDRAPRERMQLFVRPGGGSEAPAGMPPLMMGAGGGQQFTDKDLEAAKLPPPPGEANELDVLLRPGLLTDVEITVEKVPNAIHIPVQAVFEKDGKPIVYVKDGNRFEERAVKPLKRSESTMVISEGLKPGEHVALSNPSVKPGDKKKNGGRRPAVPAAGPRGAA
jgi:hypothetical protein